MMYIPNQSHLPASRLIRCWKPGICWTKIYFFLFPGNTGFLLRRNLSVILWIFHMPLTSLRGDKFPKKLSLHVLQCMYKGIYRIIFLRFYCQQGGLTSERITKNSCHPEAKRGIWAVWYSQIQIPTKEESWITATCNTQFRLLNFFSKSSFKRLQNWLRYWLNVVTGFAINWRLCFESWLFMTTYYPWCRPNGWEKFWKSVFCVC